MKDNRNTTFFWVVIILISIIIISVYSMVKTSQEEDAYNVSVVVSDSGNDKWTAFKKGLEDGAKDRNVRLNYVSTPVFNTLEDEQAFIDREISAGADAVITEFVSGVDTESVVNDISGKVVLVLAGTDADSEVDVEGKFAVIEPDNYEVGRAIGNEILLRNNEGLESLSIGIIAGNYEKNSIRARYQGLTDILKTKGCSITWEVKNSSEPITAVKSAYENKPVDIMIALDDDGLYIATDIFGESKKSFQVYGVGCSPTNYFFLDRGRIISMIVPDEFLMGYQSIESVVEKLDHKLIPMTDITVGYKVINKDNMFDEENQKYLFTVVQ